MVDDDDANGPGGVLDPRICVWEADEEGVFTTACGNRHEFDYGGVADNGYRLCPYCNKPIVCYQEIIEDLRKNWENRGLTDIEAHALGWALDEIMYK